MGDNLKNNWAGYLNAVSGSRVPSSSMPVPYLTTDPTYGNAGFLDIAVRDPKIQARYDAMSGSWEGIEATDAAVKNGIFKADSMPIIQKNNTNTK